MRDDDWLAAEFEASRPRLHAVAYRMLGSHSDADDAVQEAYLRLAGQDHDRIENVGGLLTTVVSRVCLDRLRSRRVRPEAPLGSAATGDVTLDDDPERDAELADSVGSALLVVLELLSPAERLAFVLHDVFAVPFDEVAEILERSPDATRQLASRARRRLQGSSAIDDVDRARQRELVDAFLRAAHAGDFEALLRVLDPDVVLVPDAAAVSMGSLRETVGASAVANTIAAGGARGAHLAIIDGLAGFVWAPGGRMRGAVEFTIANDRIVAMRVTGDPDRLETLDIALLDD